MNAQQPTWNQTHTDAPAGNLTCQWCSVHLPAGETRCPTCGSPGVPDPTLHAPGIELLEAQGEPVPLEQKADLHEWWLDDDEVEHQQRRAAISSSATEDHLLKTAGILVGTGAVFAFLGWLVGPVFLTPAMESLTGTPVEHASDLRPMGGIIGLLFGLFLGAGYGWIAAADK